MKEKKKGGETNSTLLVPRFLSEDGKKWGEVISGKGRGGGHLLFPPIHRLRLGFAAGEGGEKKKEQGRVEKIEEK